MLLPRLFGYTTCNGPHFRFVHTVGFRVAGARFVDAGPFQYQVRSTVNDTSKYQESTGAWLLDVFHVWKSEGHATLISCCDREDLLSPAMSVKEHKDKRKQNRNKSSPFHFTNVVKRKTRVSSIILSIKRFSFDSSSVNLNGERN